MFTAPFVLRQSVTSIGAKGRLCLYSFVAEEVNCTNKQISL